MGRINGFQSFKWERGWYAEGYYTNNPEQNPVGRSKLKIDDGGTVHLAVRTMYGMKYAGYEYLNIISRDYQ
ncbi:MAG: hypothetical protein GY862_31800 [Gammaproteobacteria bacterium]|nr:hypothetical protein [Gammaproteobacteria bacterium]